MDWPALKLLIFHLLANVPLFLVPPFLHRYGEIAAAAYLAIHAALALLLFSLIVGSAAGMHFWLLAAGELIVFYGTERLPASVAMICFLVGTFLAIVLGPAFQRHGADHAVGFAAIIKSIAVFGGAFIIAGFVYLAMHMAEQAEAALESEYARSEALLRSIMPDKIAARLKWEPQAIIATSTIR